MKEYIKPELEEIKLSVEAITDELGSGDVVSSDETRPC